MAKQITPRNAELVRLPSARAGRSRVVPAFFKPSAGARVTRSVMSGAGAGCLALLIAFVAFVAVNDMAYEDAIQQQAERCEMYRIWLDSNGRNGWYITEDQFNQVCGGSRHVTAEIARVD